MAVTTLYMSNLDKQKRTFTDKKLCDELDRKLELAESLRIFLENNVKGMEEEMAENIGMLLAENKDALMVAFKGKPTVLTEPSEPNESEESNVKALSGAKKAG
ncbi:MAG: YebG family protein [Hahellaceae bacterium]|nr:YebG family protein [Hahellaceae bacterium]MCP5213089.1 YebG family protein [Hahellaceae bacterium]